MSFGRWMSGLMVGVCAVALRAQRPAPIERHDPLGQPTQTIQVESRLVNVALNVVDEHGAPVGGLTAADFELSEDGKLQKIAIFEAESSTPLSIVLAMDASESVLSDRGLERDAARPFLRGLLRAQDRQDFERFMRDRVAPGRPMRTAS